MTIAGHRCSSQASTRPSSRQYAEGIPSTQTQFYKTKMCPLFLKSQLHNPRFQGLFAVNVGCLEGTCANGDPCRFAHSLRDLRPLPDLSKTKLCASYSKGEQCTQSRCPFAHNPTELRTSSSVFYKVSLCNFYKNNKCWNGANCRFAHGNQELRENLQKAAEKNSFADDLGWANVAVTPGTASTPGCQLNKSSAWPRKMGHNDEGRHRMASDLESTNSGSASEERINQNFNTSSNELLLSMLKPKRSGLPPLDPHRLPKQKVNEAFRVDSFLDNQDVSVMSIETLDEPQLQKENINVERILDDADSAEALLKLVLELCE